MGRFYTGARHRRTGERIRRSCAASRIRNGFSSSTKARRWQAFARRSLASSVLRSTARRARIEEASRSRGQNRHRTERPPRRTQTRSLVVRRLRARGQSEDRGRHDDRKRRMGRAVRADRREDHRALSQGEAEAAAEYRRELVKQRLVPDFTLLALALALSIFGIAMELYLGRADRRRSPRSGVAPGTGGRAGSASVSLLHISRAARRSECSTGLRRTCTRRPVLCCCCSCSSAQDLARVRAPRAGSRSAGSDCGQPSEIREDCCRADAGEGARRAPLISAEIALRSSGSRRSWSACPGS